MPLESDIDNPDSHLFVKFYEHEKEPYKGFDFVVIMNPGDKTSVFDQPATETHKMRFPRHWAAYQGQKMGGAASVIGTPLAEWSQERPDDLTSGQLSELSVLGFQTAEHVAMASDAQIQRVGMGGLGLRERARNYLSNKGRSAMPNELAETKAQLAALQEQMADMMARMSGAGATPPPRAGEFPEAPESGLAIKRGPGRPRKVTDDGLDDAATGDAGHG